MGTRLHPYTWDEVIERLNWLDSILPECQPNELLDQEVLEGRYLVTIRGLWGSECGRRIQQARDRRGWTQAVLASRLGVSQQRVQGWETGRHRPGLRYQAALSKALGLPAGFLFG